MSSSITVLHLPGAATEVTIEAVDGDQKARLVLTIQNHQVRVELLDLVWVPEPMVARLFAEATVYFSRL